MTETQKTQTIRVYVNFSASLDECPSCGFEQKLQDEFGKVECRKCNYHAGSDLAEQWNDFCEKTAASPLGEITDTHYGDGNYFDIEIPELPSLEQLTAFDSWVEDIGGRIDEDTLDGILTKTGDVWLQQFVNYSAAPLNSFHSVTLIELYAIKDDLDDTHLDETASTEWSRDALKTDREGIAWAIHQAHNGKSVFTAQDEDGYYFAMEIK